MPVHLPDSSAPSGSLLLPCLLSNFFSQEGDSIPVWMLRWFYRSCGNNTSSGKRIDTHLARSCGSRCPYGAQRSSNPFRGVVLVLVQSSKRARGWYILIIITFRFSFFGLTFDLARRFRENLRSGRRHNCTGNGLGVAFFCES